MRMLRRVLRGMRRVCTAPRLLDALVIISVWVIAVAALAIMHPDPHPSESVVLNFPADFPVPHINLDEITTALTLAGLVWFYRWLQRVLRRFKDLFDAESEEGIPALIRNIDKMNRTLREHEEREDVELTQIRATIHMMLERGGKPNG